MLGIVSLQLLFSLGMVFAFVAKPEIPLFLASNPAILFTVIGLYCATGCTLSCFPQVCKRYPTNYVILSAFTIFTAIMVGVVAATYPPEIVAAAVAITAITVVALCIFAVQTKYDFTGTFYPFYWIFFIMCITIPIGMVLSASAMDARGVSIGYRLMGALGVLMFSFFIVYDMQLIAGGKHHHQFSPDDYIYASFVLYLDIINLFLKVLQLLGRK